MVQACNIYCTWMVQACNRGTGWIATWRRLENELRQGWQIFSARIIEREVVVCCAVGVHESELEGPKPLCYGRKQVPKMWGLNG